MAKADTSCANKSGQIQKLTTGGAAGVLLAAEIAGYDVLLTVDQGIAHQQHPGAKRLSIVLIRSRTNQLEDLLPLVDAILNAVAKAEPGRIILV